MVSHSVQQIVKICIPNTFHAGFDYINPGYDLTKGMLVLVPFHSKTRVGIVVETDITATIHRLKTILAILDEKALLPEAILTLCTWVASYYQAPLSEVLALALPKSLRREKPWTQKIKSLASYATATLLPPLALQQEQQYAVDKIAAQLDSFRCYLLQGVTGSGKTEVYLTLIAKVLAKGQQALLLVPEIGLTPQLLSRVRSRFKEVVLPLHSALSESERRKAFLLAEEISVIVGTRTAVFTPLPRLGLIIVDEEHDASLKQAEGVRYSARDTALVRAQKANIPIILGSATPSLESYYNAICQKYTWLTLTQKATPGSPLHYQVVDLRNLPLEHGLSTVALQLIAKHLAQKNQVLVFINRRGYAPVLLCHHCGAIEDCPDCDNHLTLHSHPTCLLCHHCGFSKALPHQCYQCHTHPLLPVGQGTQRLYAHLQATFPDVSMLRIDRDTVKKKQELDAYLTKIQQEEVQLLIGTQMLAKGHHFPKLTLTVIVDMDAGLFHSDFRALEQLGQLLVQVAGRAGREHLPGEVLLQTHAPQHPLLQLLVQQGYDAFARAILLTREQALFPPFQYLALIRAQAKTEQKIVALLQKIKHFLLAYPLELLGPAPAPMPRKAALHRMQLLIKSPTRALLQKALNALREENKELQKRGTIRWSIDIDPIDLS